MLRTAVVILALGLAVGLLPNKAHAQFDAGDFELTLGGTAANDDSFSGFTAGANASIGYFFTDNLEIALRQSVNYTDIGTFGGGDDDDDGGGEGSALNGSTRIALDFHFDFGRFQPFVGANIGYVYGDIVRDTFEAAPEVGIKYFVNDTTFIYGMAEYQFFFRNADTDEVEEAFEDGQFVYTFGIGFRF